MTAQTFALPEAGRAPMIARIAAFLESSMPGKRLRVTVDRAVKRRSDEQNKYLWGVVYSTLRQATGQDADDWHEYMLGEWAGWEEHELFGKRRLRPVRRSSKLSTVEFADYVAFIQRRAAEHGIYIPDPGERLAA